MDENKKTLQHYLSSYLNREKRSALQFALLGFLALGLGVFGFAYTNSLVWSGAVPPLIIIGLVQLFIGSFSYSKTTRQVKTLSVQLDEQPDVFFKNEIERMEKVESSFKKYQLIEIGFFCMGFFLMMLGAFGPGSKYMMGSGAALIGLIGLIYLMNLLNSYRASFYKSKLFKFKDLLK
mgnify:CR=1 FL=1